MLRRAWVLWAIALVLAVVGNAEALGSWRRVVLAASGVCLVAFMVAVTLYLLPRRRAKSSDD